ncbi:MAG: type III pantothenate kinase [Chloroflexi bacterium]|nr:type III pantothenate kinase [Chloroflexota bacterium]MCH9037749.1 type III pantothenate kinase [Chloroflexota bacterium]MCI0796766.1 type III pantothenate kinase [Chloroflexota bacterium]MCI0841719.1 type III pantothenate kinase [Chloroflexota bacterium]
MLLALDIGNTNITLGVFQGESIYATWRVSTDASKMPDEYGVLLRQLFDLRGIDSAQVDAVALCSVVPPLTPVFLELCKGFFDVVPLVVGAGTKTGIRVLYDNPRDVGADRIVDAAAALKIYGGPVIVVDIGTATVFDAVTKDGNYLGGAIAPGMAIAADALFHSTSQLRRVELVSPKEAIGKNTVHSIQSGLVLGYAELVKGMVARFDRELGGGAKVVATGGLAHIVEQEVGLFDAVDPDLTLTGLRLIHEMNSL